MYKKRIMLCVLLMMFLMTACSDKKDTESSDVTMQKPAVETSAAGSDDVIVEEEKKEEIVTEKKETVQEEYVNDESEELTCVLPDGFEEYPDEEGLYVHKSFPKDTSTISYVISDSDSTEVTKEKLKADLEADYLNAYGDEVDITVSEFRNAKVDGRKSVHIKLEYEFKGIEYEQFMCLIYNGADAHVLNFTQEKDGKWAEAFEECIASIAFE